MGSSNIFLIRKYSPRVNVSLPNGYTSKKSENCFLECELGGWSVILVFIKPIPNYLPSSQLSISSGVEHVVSVVVEFLHFCTFTYICETFLPLSKSSHKLGPCKARLFFGSSMQNKWLSYSNSLSLSLCKLFHQSLSYYVSLKSEASHFLTSYLVSVTVLFPSSSYLTNLCSM